MRSARADERLWISSLECVNVLEGGDKSGETWGQTLALAAQAVGLSDPNPRVGCMILSADGGVLGQGHTQQAGGPHAEVMALRDAQSKGHDVRGATAYVTLEPCAHHGRTPPCADAFVAAGLGRVRIALSDPNPLVAGQGIERLLAGGVAVELLPPDHPVAREARELNIGFLSRMVRKRPWVRLKVAASLDGRTALPDGRSQWITGAAARADGHAWRARATAVLTGIGTVLDDNPRLDVRAVPVARQPWRVVLDSRWRTPVDAALMGADPGDVTVIGLAGTQNDDADTAARCAALIAAGVHAIDLPAGSDSARIDLGEVLAYLARRGVNELHVEAGARLNAAFIHGGWVDELLVYLAPSVIGPGLPFADLGMLPDLAAAPRFEWRDVARVGDDLRLMARRPGADQF
jgi:diaminohydroxyphosphoribosylaminopyrimidine deaminase/5-amino-6-(5-phosphoribosylamino)uracil reductase